MSPNKKYKLSIFSLPCTHPTNVQQWSYSLVLVQLSECHHNRRSTGKKLVPGAEEVKMPMPTQALLLLLAEANKYKIGEGCHEKAGNSLYKCNP